LRGIAWFPTRPVVDHCVRVGDGLPVDNFSDGKGNIITPPRKVNEDAIRSWNRDTSRHGAVEGGEYLETADRCVVRKRLRLGVSRDRKGDRRETKGQS
jgi:hypothetical protein